MTSSKPSCRPAVPGDALELTGIHHAAVQAIGVGVYSQDVLLAWSPRPDEARRQRIADAIRQDTTVCIVAERDGRRVGFGMAFPAQGWLRALYVDPSVAGHGIGTGLLQQLECGCLAAGASALELNASYNAEGFYRRRGYTVIGQSSQKLTDQLSMAAVHMVKQLGRSA